MHLTQLWASTIEGRDFPVVEIAGAGMEWSQSVVVDFNPADGTGSGKIFRRVMNGDVPAEPEEYSIVGTGPRQLAAGATAQKDFAAINQGQVKAVAKPYYDRLAELFAAFGGYAKPWTDATADDTSFAVASTGQLKNVFAFDLNGDSDGDGWSDIYELSHPYTGTNPLGVSPNPFNADSDGDGIADGQETGSSAWLADTDGDGFKDGEDRWPQDGRRGDYIPPKLYAVTDLSAYLPADHPAKNLEPEHITIDDEHNVSWVARNPDTVLAEFTDTIPPGGGDGVRTQKVAGPTHHVMHWKAADGTISTETLVDRQETVFSISGGLQTTAIDKLSRTIAGVTTGAAGPKGVYGSFQADLFTKYISGVIYFHGARVLRGLTAEGADGLAVPEALSPYASGYLNSMTETVDRALYYPTADKPAWDHIGDDLLDDGYTLGTNVEVNSRKGNVAGTISGALSCPQ